MGKAKRKVKELQTSVKRFPLLGEIVFWHIPECEVSTSELERLFFENNLEEFKVRKIQSRRALTKILNVVKRENPDLLVRKINEDEVEVSYGIVEESARAEDLELDYENKNAVIFNKDTYELEFKLTDEMSQRLLGAFDEAHGNYNEVDLRRLCYRVLKEIGAVTVRESGGIYFIPVQRQAVAEGLEKILDSLNSGAQFGRVGIADSSKSKQNMERAFKKELFQQIAQADEELETFLNEHDDPRASSFAKRLDRYKALRQKADMYSDLLEADVKEIKLRIRKLEKRIKKELAFDEV